MTIVARDGSRGAESGDVSALPKCLDRTSVVVLSDETDRLTARHSVQRRQTGEGSARPTVPADARDFHSFVFGTSPRLAQRVARVDHVGG